MESEPVQTCSLTLSSRESMSRLLRASERAGRHDLQRCSVDAVRQTSTAWAAGELVGIARGRGRS